MKDIDDYSRMTTGDLGIRRLSLCEAGELVAKCLWLEGELPDSKTVKIKETDRDWETIYDPRLGEPLKEHSNKFTKLLINAINNKEIKADAISRTLDGEIIAQKTYISAEDLMPWLEERGVGYGDFFEEYFNFENDLFDKAFTFVQAERIRQTERKLRLDKKHAVFTEDEHLLLYQKCRTLESEIDSLKGNVENATLVEDVRRIIRSSIGNRAKESLLVDFINQTDLDKIGDKASTIDAFFTFARAEQRREAEELINTENLNVEAAKRYITTSIKREFASDNGTELNAILPKMSPLNPQYLNKKQGVLKKIAAFVDKFKGVGGEI